MLLLATIAAAALLVAYATGGRLRKLGDLRLRWWGLAILGLLMQVAPVSGEGRPARLSALALLLGSYVVLVVFATANVRVPGAPLIIAGLALNFAVIAANGGMPVSEEALLAAGKPDAVQDLRGADRPKHHLMGADDRLTVLADVVPIPPPFGMVLSPGDFAVFGGGAWVLVAAMRGRSPAGAAPRRPRGYRGKHRQRPRPGRPQPGTAPSRPHPPAAARSGTEP